MAPAHRAASAARFSPLGGPPSRALRRIGDGLLWLGAGLGLACLLVAVGAIALGLRPLVFQSGSMAPQIPTGSLAFARSTPAAELEVGDVVSVRDASGARITHRVHAVRTADAEGVRILTLRGDANPAPDAEPYVVQQADRVLWHVPMLGYVVAWLSSPVGMLGIGGVVVAGFLLHRPRQGRRASGSHGTALLVLPVLPVLPGLTALTMTVLSPAGGALGTLAAFTDTATASTAAIASYRVPVPVITGCEVVVSGTLGTGRTARVTFTAVTSPRILTYTAVRTDTGAALPVVPVGGGALRADLVLGVLGTLLSSYTIRITAALPAPNATWVSAPTEQRINATITAVTCAAP